MCKVYCIFFFSFQFFSLLAYKMAFPSSFLPALDWNHVDLSCINTCIEHVFIFPIYSYCMHFYFPKISVEWVCESCCSRDVVSLEDGVKEDTLITMPQDSSTRACHDNVHELGPSSVRQACSEREIKPVKSGKVKYISLDEVIMLSAAASKKGASARSNSDSKPGSLSSMKPLRNSLAGSRAAASKSSASMVKSNRSLGPSDPVKHPRHGGGVSSMVDQQVPQTSKKLKGDNFFFKH